MEKTEKVVYEAPTMMVVVIKTEGIICSSMGDRGNYDPTNDNPFAD